MEWGKLTLAGAAGTRGDDGWTPVADPATGETVGHVRMCSAEDAGKAVAAAHTAFAGWAGEAPQARGAVLRRLAGLISEHTEDLATLLTAEQGKPLAESRAEVASAAGYFDFFAEEARRVNGEVVASPRADSRILVTHKPVGVVAAITPWNFPVSMVARKLGPALAAGCTVVLKPAPQTPLSALALAALCRMAGLPDGVLQVLTGDAATIGAVLTQDPRVAFLSFTGSTATGRLLYGQCAATIKKLGLELGGHAPFIVLPDADLDKAAALAVAAKFRNAGQTCVCPNRFFVHDAVYDDFLRRFLQQVDRLVPGDGRDPASTLAPLIDEAALAKVERHVADAVAKGAKLTRGGSRAAAGRTWYEATILENVGEDMLVSCEETFGPVAALSHFTDVEEVKASVNASQYGLAGYVFGRDISLVLKTAESLDLGMVGINAIHLGLEMAPIGGVKQSGLGREGGHAGILDYCEQQYLLVGL
ncbi:aldehyde dehydrogenase family protein [Sinorhizobium medicae]|uniref:NAD-dependent succinate-semialdehyde dehydrogenase n=1 Tax=Sinorhizobium medicae TaxID=110321 RepID=UPI000FD9827E|nr:NAD-dependent succinate-semialdehyde dehydrogenase [Sinorhizobium medicae]MDX1010175.1 aldehyde dehydrogenase family protein [Sinorhizobium medicae]MDX1053783.1 aldehyde dehydrogenase family protein [Sinorhizobium medicae]MDX1219489.1 aldehyde dehydrogenase family protein [Sinorhizobium medicae]MQW00327.1 aldehyde dehydrogenase family protein [Sinorhizobium medicae]RVJ44122.1 NAD-dependent succinate-semialdehyde dehydrogenase [Sinorhizobium medicae]